MLYTSEINDWGEKVYLPTTTGKIILGVIIVILLAAAIFFANAFAQKKKSEKKLGLKGLSLNAVQLCVCAAALALGTVLSEIKPLDMPTGGSITAFSMLVICLPGYFFGAPAGILTGIAYGILQLIVDPYVLYPAQLIIDYPLAFGALGLSGLFCNRKFGIIWGYLTGVFGRYVFAVISGWMFFGSYAWEGWSVLPYSLAYNAVYIGVEAAITIVVLCLPPVRRALGIIKSEVNQ